MPTLENRMYPPRLIEHFQNPRNVGELGPPAITVEVSNPACGDILRLSVRLQDGRAAEVRYKVRGGTASIAAGTGPRRGVASETRGGVGGRGHRVSCARGL